MSQGCSVLKIGMRAVPEVYGFCWCCLDTWLEGGGLFLEQGVIIAGRLLRRV